MQARAATAHALGSAFLEAAEPIGVTRYACFLLARRDGVWTAQSSLTNHPASDVGMLGGPDAIEALLRTASAAGQFWTDMNMTPAQTRALRPLLRDFRQGPVFVRRCLLEGGGQAVTLVTGPGLVSSEPNREALRWLIDTFACEAARALAFTPNGSPVLRKRLSGTQLKVLAMRIDGLSNQDIARALGRKEKTVECHITQILSRLEARNMMDAARIAAAISLV